MPGKGFSFRARRARRFSRISSRTERCRYPASRSSPRVVGRSIISTLYASAAAAGFRDRTSAGRTTGRPPSGGLPDAELLDPVLERPVGQAEEARGPRDDPPRALHRLDDELTL